MAKSKSIYSCTECGATSPKWQGQCPGCGEWNTLVESVAEKASGHRFESPAPVARPRNLAEIEARESERIATGIAEFDRALGGGLVAGGVVLIGGDPGIGKSTLLLQALSLLSAANKVLYVSGEESGEQVALRARRLGLDTRALQLMAEINLERILSTLQAEQPQVAVIDSIQTLWSDELSSAPGSVAQVRECAAQLTRLAKQTGITIILVGHVTKEGALAGPRVLEHIVDTVLYFEGDTHSSFRLVRAVKNRFGAVNELGVFAMTDKGLKGVNNPSALFLSQHGQDVAGSCAGGYSSLAGRDSGAGRCRARQSAAPDRRSRRAAPGDVAGGSAPPCRYRLLRSGCLRERRRRGPDQRTCGRPCGIAFDHIIIEKQGIAIETYCVW
jgi:DNA repair protein RadA/Sms